MEKKIAELAASLGASIVGIGNIEGIMPEEYSHLKRGISIGIRLSDQILNEVKTEPTQTYYHHYRTVNFLIDQICLRISMLLQEEGYLAMGIPASQTVKSETENFKGLVSHKMVATRAGLGWIGKSACLITPEFGPRLRLGTVLTNMPLDYNEPKNSSDCGECKICMSKCPAFAIKGVNWELGREREEFYDAFACSRHMSEAYREIGRGSVCGICVSSCPVGNRRLKKDSI